MSRWCLYLRRVAVVWRVASFFQRLPATACVARIVRTPLSLLKSACVLPCKGCSLARNLSRPCICSASPSVVLITSLSWCGLLSVAGRSGFRKDLGKRKRESRGSECMVLSVLFDATVQGAHPCARSRFRDAQSLPILRCVEAQRVEFCALGAHVSSDVLCQRREK